MHMFYVVEIVDRMRASPWGLIDFRLIFLEEVPSVRWRSP